MKPIWAWALQAAARVNTPRRAAVQAETTFRYILGLSGARSVSPRNAVTPDRGRKDGIASRIGISSRQAMLCWMDDSAKTFAQRPQTFLSVEVTGFVVGPREPQVSPLRRFVPSVEMAALGVCRERNTGVSPLRRFAPRSRGHFRAVVRVQAVSEARGRAAYWASVRASVARVERRSSAAPRVFRSVAAT